MHEILEYTYAIALVVTLVTTAAGLGAKHDPRDFRVVLTKRALFARLVILDVVLVPLVVLALIHLLAVPTEYGLGLLLVGTASAGALGLKTSQLAHGDLPLAIALVVVLELANIVAMPIWASVLMPSAISLPLIDILRTLVVGILIPLLVGVAIHARTPRRAAPFSRGALQVSTIGLVIVIGAVLVRDSATVIDALGSGVPGVAVGTTVAVLALGWWFGGPDPGSRRTAALVSTARGNAVALAIATTMFGASAGSSSAIVVFGLISTVIASVAAVLLGRRSIEATYDLASQSDLGSVPSS